MMPRRTFVGGLAAVLAAPVAATAQPTSRTARIGVLDAVAFGAARQYLWDGFRQRLRQLGFADGEVALELRSANGQTDRLPGLAADLVRLNVDVIVAASTLAALAVKRATSTIPTVMTNSGDPVSVGLVASLARPGGNVTGLTTLSPELSAKRLQLLREIVPTLSRVAVLWEERNPAFASAVRETEASGKRIGVHVVVLGATVAADIDRVVGVAVAQKAGGLIVMPGSVFFTGQRRLMQLTEKHRLPSVFAQREFVDAGGLVAYGASLSDLFARAADFVAKILKGAKPADLPVEQPAKFELVVNLKTAKTIGLAIPQSLLLRADHVLQ
jgi:putative ABC transport system substrate-binding protein